MLSGIINIDKISGFSSLWHDKFIKKVTGVKKAGHTGTLDPFATGLLTICIGKATRLAKYLSGDKTYIAEALWGVETDTSDITGNVILHSKIQIIDDNLVERVLGNFTGSIVQLPPIYSAIKVKGVPLYKYARNNKTVDIPSRNVEVYSINLLKNFGRHSMLEISCSKGTYIRSIIRDIGRQIGCYGTTLSLRRISSDHFSIDDAFNLDKIADKAKGGNIRDVIIPMAQAVSFYPTITVGRKDEELIKNGMPLQGDFPEQKVAIVNTVGELIAMGKSGTGIKPKIVL